MSPRRGTVPRMDQKELLAEASSLPWTWPDERREEELTRLLAEPGTAAVPGLVAALDVNKRGAFRALKEALRRIGPPAFDAVLAACTTEPEVPNRWEVNNMLINFDEQCLDRYIAALAHPEERIRSLALHGLQNLGPKASRAAGAVLPFLQDKKLGYWATNAIQKMSGPEVVEEFRTIRANGPAHLRRPALIALAEIGGLGALGERDRHVVERLVRIKTASEAIWTCRMPQHFWMAVPGATYEGFFDALDLHDRVPCTMDMGLSADLREHVPYVDGDKEYVASRVFVTPELDGWRLVYGETLLEMGYGPGQLVEMVSAKCGEAQIFYEDGHAGGLGWMMARDGDVVRGYWKHSDPEWTGDPLPWEDPVGLGFDLDEDEDEDEYDLFEDEEGHEPNASGETGLVGPALNLSVLPGGASSFTDIRGHGWLAITAPGVGHDRFPGALTI